MNSRKTYIEVDLEAIRANAESLLEIARTRRLCAVVKADAYGHGSVQVARAALEGGAQYLAVALTEEAITLRDAGIKAPILLLSEPAEDVFEDIVQANITPIIYSTRAIKHLSNAVSNLNVAPYSVHFKIDTGMHRVGCDSQSALELANAIHRSPELKLDGLCTHFATADEKLSAGTDAQLRLFRTAVDSIKTALKIDPIVHAANSAAALRYPETRFNMIRCGIALYGLQPSANLMLPNLFRPALTFRSAVSAVRRLHAGDALSYGQRYRLTRDANIAVVPVGYADGVARRSFDCGVDVLIGGRRRHVVGTVTMDQIMVNCGDDTVRPGDEVVLIGTQQEVTIAACEIAERINTIDYEVVCSLGSRLPRCYINE